MFSVALGAVSAFLFCTFQGSATGATNAAGGKTSSKAQSPGSKTTNEWQRLAEDFSVADRSVGYKDPDDFAGFLSSARRGGQDSGQGWRGVVKRRGWLIACLLIALGGLALNLTPCILPMIPVNLAIIGAGAQAATRRRGCLLGGIYGLGMAVIYGATGVLVVLTGARFGTLNASPWFNAAVSVLFVVLSLVVLGVIKVDVSKLQSKAKEHKKEGSLPVAFVLGGVMALLAGACVAPVVVSVMFFSADLYAEGHAYGLLLPFLLGVGMALPWPFAGAGLSFLPEPGGWTRYIKYLFGIIVLGFAVYYGYQAAQLFRNRLPSSREQVEQSQEQALDQGWLTSLSAGFGRARREGMPLLIDFWASWCKACTKMNDETFSARAVKDAMQPFVRVKYRAENPNDPEVKKVLDHFEVTGLPTYLVLKPRQQG